MVTGKNSAENQLKMLSGEGSMQGAGVRCKYLGRTILVRSQAAGAARYTDTDTLQRCSGGRPSYYLDRVRPPHGVRTPHGEALHGLRLP
jgi:hypothetical protein